MKRLAAPQLNAGRASCMSQRGHVSLREVILRWLIARCGVRQPQVDRRLNAVENARCCSRDRGAQRCRSSRRTRAGCGRNAREAARMDRPLTRSALCTQHHLPGVGAAGPPRARQQPVLPSPAECSAPWACCTCTRRSPCRSLVLPVVVALVVELACRAVASALSGAHHRAMSAPSDTKASWAHSRGIYSLRYFTSVRTALTGQSLALGPL